MKDDELAAWCALWRAPGVGSKTFHNVLATFGSPTLFFASSDREVQQSFSNIAPEKWQPWHRAQKETDWQQDLTWCAADPNRHILTLEDARYPALLREITDPPPLLFVQGDVDLLSAPQLAVVGSRQPTAAGIQNCTQIAQKLVENGLLITSGMALGIDGAAHQAALAVHGKTLAVVGTGLDRVYPARHRELAHQIAANGAIVSEFPVGTGVRAHHFPRRNRIISGLSLGVLVVEASIQSGSLITARLAAEQGREVFALPGSIHNPLARGCHQLIREGAKLVESYEDIVEELLPLAKANVELQQQFQPHHLPQNEPQTHQEYPANSLENRLLNIMGYDPWRVDDLVEKTHLTAAEISAMLLMLELDGAVASLSGGRYQRSHKE